MTQGIGLAPGDVLEGRYRLERLLGEGGFGAVYQATQLNLERQVAIKVVLPQLLSTPELLDRFLREAKVAQRLDHPNTVRMYDFGHTEHGVPYIAWELLKGRPLDAVLESERALPSERVVRITTQVLKALMEAHAQGIVHRDIKPANIFLSNFQGEPDFVKVLDFGIAKALDATEAQGGKNLTLAGQIIGTPNYMAPEQVEGKVVGPTADLYALGLVMAEMLSGKVVLDGTGLAVCAAHLAPEPLPIPPAVLNSPLGPVVTRATEKRLEHRYGGASEMLEDLRRVSGEVTMNPSMGMPAVGNYTNPYQSGGPSAPGSWGGVTTPGSPQSLTPQPTVNTITGSASGGGSKLLFAIIGILAMLVGVGGLLIMVMAYFLVDDDGDSDFGDGPVATLNNGNTTTIPSGPQPNNTTTNTNNNVQTPGPQPGQPINRNLSLITPELLSQRIQAAGYTLLQTPTHQNMGSVRTITVTGISGQSTVTVLYYEYDISIASMAIPALANSLRQQQGAVHSDNQRVLYVRCIGNPPHGSSQQILERILR